MSAPPRIVVMLLLAAAGLAHAQQLQLQPGRIACGTTAPNQAICDSLSHPTSRRAMRVPVESECVRESRSGGYFCGFSGAK